VLLFSRGNCDIVYKKIAVFIFRLGKNLWGKLIFLNTIGKIIENYNNALHRQTILDKILNANKTNIDERLPVLKEKLPSFIKSTFS
jgi:hypothetical protein